MLKCGQQKENPYFFPVKWNNKGEKDENKGV